MVFFLIKNVPLYDACTDDVYVLFPTSQMYLMNECMNRRNASKKRRKNDLVTFKNQKKKQGNPQRNEHVLFILNFHSY